LCVGYYKLVIWASRREELLEINIVLDEGSPVKVIQKKA
jgi:hypothetical protein